MHEYLHRFRACVYSMSQLLVIGMTTIKNKTMFMFMTVSNLLVIAEKKILSQCTFAAHLFYHYFRGFTNY